MQNRNSKSQSLPSASLVQNGFLLGDVDLKALKLICSNDDLRKWMTEPFSVGDHTASTNGWSLLVVEKKSDYPDMSDKTKVFILRNFVLQTNLKLQKSKMRLIKFL